MPRKPGRGAETHLGHLRKPCSYKSGGSQPVELAGGWRVVRITQGLPCTGESRGWAVEEARPKELTWLPGWPDMLGTATKGASECGSVQVNLEGWSIRQVG